MVLGQGIQYEISESRYEMLRYARENLLELLYIEEKFDLLIENFLDFEAELLILTTRFMAQTFRGYDTFQIGRGALNRKIMNLLSSCRSYLDQMPLHVTELALGVTGLAEEFRAFRWQVRNESRSYRIMQEIRNYAQHRDLPIHTMTFQSELTDPVADQSLIRHGIRPMLRVMDIATDPRIDRDVLVELQSLGEFVDFRPLAREYVDAICSIHRRLREMVSDHIGVWEDCLFQAIADFRAQIAPNDDILGIAAIHRDDLGALVEEIAMFTELVDRRRELTRKNNARASFARRFATSEVF